MKKVAFIIVASLSLLLPSAAMADVQLVGGMLPVSARQFQEMVPLWDNVAKPSVNYTVRGGGDTIAAPAAIKSDHGLCSKVDTACLTDTKSLFMRGYFGDCNTGDPAPCILGVKARVKGSSNWIQGEVDEHIDYKPSIEDVSAWVSGMNSDQYSVEQFGAVASNAGLGTSYPANNVLGTLGSAGGPITFHIPGILNKAGTDQYLVDSRFEINYPVDSNKHTVTVQTPSNVWMSIRPFSVAGYGQTPIQGARIKNGISSMTGSVGSDFYTAYTLKNRTGLAAGFPDNTEFQLTVKVPDNFSNWFHGRVNMPEVLVSASSAGVNTLTISGEPIQEQITSATITTSDPLFDDYTATDPALAKSLKEKAAQNLPGGVGWGWNPDAGIDSMYLKWAKLFSEKAKGVGTIWSLSSLQSSNTCMSGNKGLQGLLFTNAMAYQASTPTFSNGFLSYSVAGTHLDHNGEVFQGNYVFMMRDSVARCLYGFSDAPIYGSVSVTSANGSEQVAVTNVTDKNGWLKLNAQGFTFSNPVISAKLTQSKIVTKSITCVKGKTSKVVKGVAPKCPAGYKIKK